MIRFIVWMALGFVIYFAYARHHSKLATGEEQSGIDSTHVLSDR